MTILVYNSINTSGHSWGAYGVNHGPPSNSIFGSSLCLYPSDVLSKLVLHTMPPRLLWAASSSGPLRIPLEDGTGDIILRLP